MKLTKMICLTALTIGAAACNNAQSGKTASTTGSAKTPLAAPSGRMAQRHMMHRPRGIHLMRRRWHHGLYAAMLFGATQQLKLTDAQKASVDKLRQQFGGPDATGDKAFKDFNDALAEGVKAGKVDTSKLEPLYAELDKAVQARHDKEVEALNGLHTALDSTARKALVDVVRKQQKMRQEHMANKPAAATAKMKNWKAQFMKNRLDRMTKELDLDATQQKKVDALLKQDQPPMKADKDRDTMNKRVDALLTAFAKDTFDAKTLDLGDLPVKKAHAQMDHRVQFLNKLLPILKPEQRDKYATAMQRRPAMRGMGPMLGRPHRLHMQLPFDQAPAAPAPPGAPGASPAR